MMSATSTRTFPSFPGTEGDGGAIGVLLATRGGRAGASNMLRCYFMGFVARSDHPGPRPERHALGALLIRGTGVIVG